MSKTKSFILKLLPLSFQQKVRNKYYENKISQSTLQDEIDLNMVKQLVEKGQNAVDIGANFGLYSKFLSEFTGHNGKVFAFEPINRTFLSLRHNIKHLGLDNVDVFQFALSDKEEKVLMEIPDYKEGGENLYEAKISNRTIGENLENIQTKVLDNVLENKELHFIKIDVEGHELNVLKGAKSILEINKPILLVEINGGINSENKNAVAIVSFLKKIGYQSYKYKNEKLLEVNDNDNGFNYYFLTEAHAKKFGKIISG